MTSLLLDPRRTVVFAGDSVTDCGRRTDPEYLGTGYVRDLYDDLGAARPRIVNAGIRGNRAVDLVRRWSTDVLAHEPSLVSILIGINDTWRRYDEDDPTTAESFEASYRELLDQLDCPVVLVEPFLLPVKPPGRGVHQLNRFTLESSCVIRECSPADHRGRRRLDRACARRGLRQDRRRHRSG